MKYSTILVTLDGSSLAECALPVAARIAQSTGGSITLLQAVRAPVEFESGAASPVPWALPVSPEERETAQRYLAGVRQAHIPAETPVEICVVAGPPGAMILAASVRFGADLIVMTSHGRTGMGRWLLGSVAAEVVREARVPVFVVRESTLTGVLADHGSTPPAAPDAANQRSLSALVPLDGSPLAEAALRPAVLLLDTLTSPAPISLHLLALVEPLPLTGTAAFGRGVAGEGHVVLTAADTLMLGEAEEYLCSIGEQIQREATVLAPGCALSVTWAALYGTDVAQTILTIAERGYEDGEGALHATHMPPSDVIAMATHGRGGFRRWVMGSVSDRVLHAAHTPLLIVRPTQVIQIPR